MTPTLQEFYDRLARHDWYYQFSDDWNVLRKGDHEIDRIQLDSVKFGPEYEALLLAFVKHHFSGKPWGTEQLPLPERPGEPS